MSLASSIEPYTYVTVYNQFEARAIISSPISLRFTYLGGGALAEAILKKHVADCKVEKRAANEATLVTWSRGATIHHLLLKHQTRFTLVLHHAPTRISIHYTIGILI